MSYIFQTFKVEPTVQLDKDMTEWFNNVYVVGRRGGSLRTGCVLPDDMLLCRYQWDQSEHINILNNLIGSFSSTSPLGPLSKYSNNIMNIIMALDYGTELVPSLLPNSV